MRKQFKITKYYDDLMYIDIDIDIDIYEHICI
jgi:hypothetical protein